MAHVQIDSNEPRETYHPASPQATFTIPFAFFDYTDIKVIVDGDEATTYTVTPTTDREFSVAGSAVDGGYQVGSITLGATVSGVDVIVYRDVPDTRTTDFPYPSPTLNIKELNTQLDKVFALFQQLGRDIGRTVKLAVSSTLQSINLPVPEAAKLLRWNASEDGLENVDVTGMGAVSLPLSLAQGGTSANHPNVASLFNAIKQAATELAIGAAKIATQALANAGVNDTDFVTPLKLWNAALRGGWRNIVGANGGFEVWENGTSIAVPASTVAYTAPRWYLATGVNQASTVSRQAGLVDASRYSAQVQRNAGQTGVAQQVFGFPLDTDEAIALRGRKVALRVLLSAGANWSPAAGALLINFAVGTAAAAKRALGFTGDTVVLTTTVNLTPGGGPVVATIPLSAAMANNIQQGELDFLWTPVGTAGAADYFRVDDVMLEEAPAVPAFERRPFEDELRACRRHTYVVGGGSASDVIGSGYNRSTTVQRVFIPFKVPMRVPPTGITVANPANFSVIHAATSTAATGIAFVAATTEGAFLDVTVAAGLTAGQGSLLQATNANATITFTGAEI